MKTSPLRRQLPNGRELPCLTTASYKKAIVHVDLDSFFASVAQEQDPSLRNRPVVVGKERGIATAMSAEAKQAGVTRGMRNQEIKECCPECVLLPTDYETVSIYSRRFFTIVRDFSADVEEYSVDECFADITGMRRALHMTYQRISQAIKRAVDTKLGTSCSVGLAPTKTLAKVASSWNKPNGFCEIPGKYAQYYLKDVPIRKIWGIGAKREHFLQTHGIKTALDFASQPQEWVRDKLNKPELEIWHELRGQVAKPVDPEPVTTYHSISKRKTFTPPSSDETEVFSRLCKNIENACIKARRYKLGTREAVFSLKTQNFANYGGKVELPYICSDPSVFIKACRPLFTRVFSDRKRWRTTYFSLRNLETRPAQMELFGGHEKKIKREIICETVDKLNGKFGKHCLYLGATHLALESGDHAGERGEPCWRQRPENWFPGETKRQRVNIPFMGAVK